MTVGDLVELLETHDPEDLLLFELAEGSELVLDELGGFLPGRVIVSFRARLFPAETFPAGFEPGVRLVDGKACYSADWLR